MPTLTKTQLEHAKAKVANLVAARMQAFYKTLGPRPKMPEFTPAERRAMILGGTATIKPNFDFEASFRYESFVSCFNFPPKPGMVAAQQALDAYDQAVTDERAKISAIEERVIDELVMSPDGMAALAKIAEAFAS